MMLKLNAMHGMRKMEEWKEYKLGELCDTISETYKKKSKEVVLINTSDVLEGKCLNHTKVANEKLKGQFKKTFQYNDILYSEIRPANKRFAFVDFDATDYIASTKLMVLRHNDKITPQYLYYILKSQNVIEELQMLAESRSGTFPQITFSELSNLKVWLPNKKTQNKIISILSSLDDKIEVNRRINEQLEELAQALFKSWFVDFEPFKDGEFVESELGMIPEGWKVGNLLDVAELFDSLRKPLSGREREAMEKIYPYHGATSIMDYVDNYIFDGIYLLMGEDGSVVNDKGYPYLQYVWGKFWPNNHAHVMQGKNGYTTEMLHALLSITNVKAVVTGAVQPKISQAGMRKIPVILAPKNLLETFAEKLVPIYDKIRANSNEITHLTNLRDTLLPKLMSGEIDVEQFNVIE